MNLEPELLFTVTQAVKLQWRSQEIPQWHKRFAPDEALLWVTWIHAAHVSVRVFSSVACSRLWRSLMLKVACVE
jgi:hypothetical protein